MPLFEVYISQRISTIVEVEAEDADEAADKVFDTDRELGVMFLDHEYPDEDSAWEVDSVEEVT